MKFATRVVKIKKWVLYYKSDSKAKLFWHHLLVQTLVAVFLPFILVGFVYMSEHEKLKDAQQQKLKDAQDKELEFMGAEA